jgi:uncharacterized protein (DUF983 family)
MDPAKSFPLPRVKTLLWRGFCKKCPQCGKGAIYQRWMKLHERCPVCGLKFLDNEGDLLGTLLFVDRVLFLIPLIVLIYFRVWHPNLTIFFIVGSVVIFLLLYTMPNRNGISLAVDYLIRRRSNDLADEEAAEAEKK